MQSRELVKLYYRIGEVSEIVGVQPHVLRYWETEFRSIRPQKSSKGQRVYSRRDVEKLLRVKDLLRNQGFTIAGARKRLSDPNEPASSPASNPSPPALAPVAPAVVSLVDVAPSVARVVAPAVVAPAVVAPAVVAPAVVAPAVVAPAVAALEGTRVHAATTGSVELSAKDMRKALLGLRQDLMRMLGEISTVRARQRDSH
jgi:DNA-binding transcriptional MerR regulator